MTNPLVLAATYNKRPINVLGGDRIDPDKMTRELGNIEAALKFATSYVGNVFNVNDSGADPTGARDSVAGFQRAINAAMTAGGGVITGAGTYKFVATTTYEKPFPISAANYQPATLDVATNLYALNAENIVFEMPDVTIETTATGSTNDAVFLFDGARNVTFNIGKIVTTTDLNLSTGTVNTTGRNAITLTATERDSYNISVPSLVAEHCYTGVYVFGVTLSATRVRGLRIGTMYADECLYGVRLFDNGDDVAIASLVTRYVGRPLFAFGVSGVTGNISNTLNLSGLQLLLKAYDRDTQDVAIRYRVYSDNTGSARVALSSEHNVAAQPTPGVLRNIAIDYDDTGSNSPALGINFSYLVDGVSTPTCATTLFNGIRLSGVMDDSSLTASVLQSPIGNLETSGLVAIGGSSYIPLTDVYEDGGFYRLIQAPNDQSVFFRNAADSGNAATMGATTADNLSIANVASGKAIQYGVTTGGTHQFLINSVEAARFDASGFDSALGILLPTVAKTTTYTAAAADYLILADATGGAFDVDLPAVATNAGRVYVIKKTDASANVVTVDPNGAETIDGAANYPLGTQYQSVTIQCDGATWWVE